MTGQRFAWPDLARGVAVVSMFVAHVAPGGGIILLSEFLTAPLFALLVVVSLTFSWRQRRVSVLTWYLIQAARGGLLVVLGIVLQMVYWQIASVLQALGILTIVAAAIVPLVLDRPRICLVGAVLGAILTPTVKAFGWGLQMQAGGSRAAIWWLDILATGRAYRVFTFLAYGLLGIALLGLIRWLGRARRSMMAACAATVLAAGILVGDQLTTAELRTYAGTTRETLFSMALAAAAVLWCVALDRMLGEERVNTVLAPLTTTGRMALTAYVLQFLALRFLTDVFLNSGKDDHWWVLGVLTVGVVGFCWVWERLGWPRPVEWVLRVPQFSLKHVGAIGLRPS